MSIHGKNTFRTVLRLGPPTPLFARRASAFPLKPTNKGNLFDRHPLCSCSPGPLLWRAHPFPRPALPFFNLLGPPLSTTSNERKGEEKEEEDKGGVQCSQPSSPSVFGGGRGGLRLIVRLFGGRWDRLHPGR